MGLRKIFDRLGDMLMPKEIAPYAGILAPMITPFTGIGGGLALSQLGSAKQNSGKLDPYSAFGVVAAGMTPQARARRMAGRIDPSQGTLGQRLSGNFSDYLSGTGLNESSLGRGIIRGIDPTQSMSMLTSGGPGNYYESPALSKARASFDEKNEIGLPSEKVNQVPGIDYEFDDDNTLISKSLDPSANSADLLEADMATRYGSFKTDEEITELLGGKDSAKGKAFEELDAIEKEAFRKKLGREGGSQKFFGDAIEGVSEFAMPGFTTDNEFDFSKAVTTIGTATTLGSMNAIKEELKKQKMKDKEEEQKVYREWFEQYERVTGQPYSQSSYPEDFLKEKYAEIYGAFATGGRVGYNMGGGIMSAPGVPDGMQIDGRDGIFISQGVEEKADDVPAMLSKNEFVLTADAMAGLDKMNGGSGDPRAAAKEMYRIMDQLEAMA